MPVWLSPYSHYFQHSILTKCWNFPKFCEGFASTFAFSSLALASNGLLCFLWRSLIHYTIILPISKNLLSLSALILLFCHSTHMAWSTLTWVLHPYPVSTLPFYAQEWACFFRFQAILSGCPRQVWLVYGVVTPSQSPSANHEPVIERRGNMTNGEFNSKEMVDLATWLRFILLFPITS